MQKISEKRILLGLQILVILAFAVMAAVFDPGSAAAEGGRNYVFTTGTAASLDPSPISYDYSGGSDYQEPENPRPRVRSLTPDSGERGMGIMTVTITGSGFIPGSVARINDVGRATTFIDPSHLMMEVNLSEAYRTEGGFYVSVWNGAPGGGYSNAVFFTLKGALPPIARGDAYNSYNYSYTREAENTTDSSLASSVILGESSFMPSGLVQWILTAIIILAIIILARRVFGARHNYEEMPLKHA